MTRTYRFVGDELVDVEAEKALADARLIAEQLVHTEAARQLCMRRFTLTLDLSHDGVGTTCTECRGEIRRLVDAERTARLLEVSS